MSLPRTRPPHFTVGVDGGSVRRSGSRLALGQRQRKEKQTKSTSTHVPPPQGLCGDRVFRLPEHSAGSTGPSTPAGPIRPTPVFRQISPGGGVLPLRRFSLPPAAAQKVNCPEGAREAPLEGSLLSRQKRMRGGSPAGPPRPPPGPPGKGSACRHPPSPWSPHPSGLRPSTFPQGGRRFAMDLGNSSVRREGPAGHLRRGSLIRHLLCKCHLPPVGEGSPPGLMFRQTSSPSLPEEPARSCLQKKSGAFAPLLPRPYKALRRSPRTGRGTAASAPPSGSR